MKCKFCDSEAPGSEICKDGMRARDCAYWLDQQEQRTLERTRREDEMQEALKPKLRPLERTDLIVMIDDVREKMVDVILRNSDAVQLCMPALRGKVSTLLLDHDLGYESSNGWEILKWLEHEKLLPNRILIITDNPGAGDVMGRHLLSIGYKYGENPRVFVKEATGDEHVD